MAKRRRKRRASGKRRSGNGGRFGAMLFGLGAGIAIASAAWWLLASRPPVQPAAVAGPARDAAPEQAEPSEAAPVEIEPSGAGYDFYEMLPEQEVVISDDFRERRERGTRATAAPEALVEPGSYILQAGSFRNEAGAESVKARLALQGVVPATVRPVPTPGGTLHQVRVGPLDRDTANEYRRRLAAAGIDVMVLRVAP